MGRARLLIMLATVLVVATRLTVAMAAHAQSSTRTKGYRKKNGTYVAPHRQTNKPKAHRRRKHS